MNKQNKNNLCKAILMFYVVCISINYVKQFKKASPKAVEQTKVLEVAKVEAVDTPWCFDAITCIRDVGEELGKDNQTIITMIKIAKKESNLNPREKNKTSSASGLFQIIAGTWYSNDCTGDKWNAEDNTRCAYKIQSKRGYQPWEVWNKGLIK